MLGITLSPSVHDLSNSSWDRYRSRVSGRPEFSDELPLCVMPEEILTPGEGQIRGLIAIAGNPVLSMADGIKTEEALQHVPFMVSVDFYMNETTRFADIILIGEQGDKTMFRLGAILMQQERRLPVSAAVRR